MKKLLSLILSLLILTLSLLSCAQPSAQEEATPALSQTPTAQPIAAPSPTPDEPDYDSIVLPEPKSEKWEDYDRIIFSIRSDRVQKGFDTRENGIFNDCARVPVGTELWCGAYPFNESTNDFYAERTVIKEDDMIFIDVGIIRESVREELKEAYDKKLSEVPLSKEAEEYIDGLKEYLRLALHDPNSPITQKYASYRIYNQVTFGRSLFLADTIATLEEWEAKYDEQWTAEHGDLSAKDYLNNMVSAIEYRHKAAYALCKDDIEYFNSLGFDLYYQYDINAEKYYYLLLHSNDFSARNYGFEPPRNENSIDIDPRLRGFVRADTLENLDDIKPWRANATYFIYYGSDFLTDYCGMTLDDLPDYSGEFETKYEELFMKMLSEI